jgi:hypothetical protein
MATAPPSNIAEEPVALGPPALKWAFLGYSAPIPHSFLQVVYYIYIYVHNRNLSAHPGLACPSPSAKWANNCWPHLAEMLPPGMATAPPSNIAEEPVAIRGPLKVFQKGVGLGFRV